MHNLPPIDLSATQQAHLTSGYTDEEEEGWEGLRRDYDRLESRCHALEDEVARLRDERDELSSKLIREKDVSREQSTQADKLAHDLEKALEELTEAKRTNANKTAKHEQIVAGLRSEIVELGQLREKCVSQSKQLERYKEYIDRAALLAVRVEELEGELDKKDSDRVDSSELAGKIADQQTLIEELKNKLAEALADLDGEKKATAEAEGECELLRIKLEMATAQRILPDSPVRETEKMSDASASPLRPLDNVGGSSMKAKIAKLEQRLQTFEDTDISKLLAEKEKLEARLDMAERMVETYKNRAQKNSDNSKYPAHLKESLEQANRRYQDALDVWSRVVQRLVCQNIKLRIERDHRKTT